MQLDCGDVHGRSEAAISLQQVDAFACDFGKHAAPRVLAPVAYQQAMFVQIEQVFNERCVVNWQGRDVANVSGVGVGRCQALQDGELKRAVHGFPFAGGEFMRFSSKALANQTQAATQSVAQGVVCK